MAAIDAAVIPWLIAKYGISYADWDIVDTATHMSANVITMQQLGGYTVQTLQSTVFASSKWPFPGLFCAQEVIILFSFLLTKL